MTGERIAKWQFQRTFRRGAFGWRSSNLAIERIAQAVSEIQRAAGEDPVRGAEGAVAFIARLSPAIEQVDSSSGALGSFVSRAIDDLVPIVAGAPLEEKRRLAVLEKLWNAFLADEIPYLEHLGERWGDFCGGEKIAARWAERLLPGTLEYFKPSSRRSSADFRGAVPCLSALVAAKQYAQLLSILERDDSSLWHYRCWGFRALVAQGKRAEALRYAEASRGKGYYESRIAHDCETLLLESGMAEEAYRRYALAASVNHATYLARFRALAKRYPWKNPGELIRDLVAATPGKEGKWFAAAKSAGLYDEAIELACTTPCDPMTLSRAARDFKQKRPAFAMEAALAALRWFAEGYGYEVTSADVNEAYRHGLAAAENADAVDDYERRALAYKCA